MQPNRRLVIVPWKASIVALSVSIGLTAYAVAGPPAANGKKAVTQNRQTAAPLNDNTPLTEDQKIIHVLNRLGFGPRPGDIARVRQFGLNRYIEQQLHPETIDDAAVENKVSQLTLLKQSDSDLASTFYNRQKGAAKLAKTRQKMEQSGVTPETMQDPAMKPEDRATKLREAMQGLTPEERQELQAYRNDQMKIREAGQQLVLDKTVRAIESERQLQEVLTDFWSNHFNIDISKGACQALKISDERNVIRPHLFGKFRDLLEASAKSPAMLFYLDNVLSTAPLKLTPLQERRRQRMLEQMEQSNDPTRVQAAQTAKNRRAGGINENYAREIMELHTLGVDGGYSQQDVQEVARCLTGWAIDRQTGTFMFLPTRHDNGEKVVLGQSIPANGGIQDGERVLDLLATNPATMRHISEKLCRRFVADEPPKTLIDKCVATWKRTDGDLTQIYGTIFTSPEFYSRAAYRQKIKSPFEFAVSSVRALGGTVLLDNTMPTTRLAAARRGGMGATRSVPGQVALMGQQLFRCQPPTGWPEDSRKWVSSGALIARLNYSLSLAGRKLADVQLPTTNQLAEDPARWVNHLADLLLQGELSPSTRATLLKQATTSPQDSTVATTTDATTRLTALVLGSPEFQRR